MIKLEIKVSDTESDNAYSAEIDLNSVNELYEKYGINGITQVCHLVIDNMNEEFKSNIELSIPDELSTLPPGRQW